MGGWAWLGRRLGRWFNRAAGLDVAVKRLEVAEGRDQARYTSQQESALRGNTEKQRVLQRIALEEKSHAKALASLAPQLGAQTVLDVILKRERWHRRGGSWVADAIYGVNDGLGAVFGIVSGVAGATAGGTPRPAPRPGGNRPGPAGRGARAAQ